MASSKKIVVPKRNGKATATSELTPETHWFNVSITVNGIKVPLGGIPLTSLLNKENISSNQRKVINYLIARSDKGLEDIPLEMSYSIHNMNNTTSVKLFDDEDDILD